MVINTGKQKKQKPGAARKRSPIEYPLEEGARKSLFRSLSESVKPQLRFLAASPEVWNWVGIAADRKKTSITRGPAAFSGRKMVIGGE